MIDSNVSQMTVSITSFIGNFAQILFFLPMNLYGSAQLTVFQITFVVANPYFATL